MQYSEKVLDHFTHPRNVGEIEDANGVGEVGNAKCGDIMKIYLKVSDDGIIEEVQDLRLRRGDRDQLDGDRDGQGQEPRGGAQADQQGSCRGARRSAPGQDALLRAR